MVWGTFSALRHSKNDESRSINKLFMQTEKLTNLQKCTWTELRQIKQ